MSSIAQRVQDALRAGRVLPDATLRTWQATPAGKYHSKSVCSKRTLTVIIDHRVLDPAFCELPDDKWCTMCAGEHYAQPNPWMDWLEIARTIADADTDGELAAPGRISLYTTGQLGALQAAAERWLELPAHCCAALPQG